MPVGIGPVEHDDRTAEFGTGIHHAEHRYIIGVEPQSDVLHIDHQHVERLHRLVRGAFGYCRRRATNRDSRPLVHRVSDMLARIGRSPESVFGRKDPRHIESAAVQQIAPDGSSRRRKPPANEPADTRPCPAKPPLRLRILPTVVPPLPRISPAPVRRNARRRYGSPARPRAGPSVSGNRPQCRSCRPAPEHAEAVRRRPIRAAPPEPQRAARRQGRKRQENE